MISSFFTAVISRPFYNGLIFLIDKLPFLDVGVVVIIFTIIVKIILLPLSLKASRAQIQMKSIEKDLQTIKEKHKDNKEEQTKQTLEYYKINNINPFAGIFILFLQLPIIIGLYQVFLKSGLPTINTAMLYAFVTAPIAVNMMFLNWISIADKSIILALIAGITTYYQMHIATPSTPTQDKNTTPNMQTDLAKAMTTQMKYFFPILVVFISYSISAGVALYWITSNIFAIAQEIYIKKKYHVTPVVV